jgi:hypothetical protein
MSEFDVMVAKQMEIERLRGVVREMESNTTFIVNGFGGVLTEFNTLEEAKSYANLHNFTIREIATLTTFK